MRNKKNLAVMLMFVAACLVFVASASAQSPVGFAASGSSAMWQTFGIAARVDNANGGTNMQGNCYSGTPGVNDNFHIWTGGNVGGVDMRAIIHDSRVEVGTGATIPDVKGNVWIVWDDTPDPNKNICLYVNVDSSVGDRALFAVPQAVINFGPAVVAGVGGDNLVNTNLLNGAADEALPANVLASVSGVTVNVAMSDIRPDDAWYASQRVFWNVCDSGTCLGYPSTGNNGNIMAPVGTANVGAFVSQYSGASLSAAMFSIPGSLNPCDTKDPISQACVPSPINRQNSVEIGAAPVVVVVNTTNNGTGHLGDPTLTNINNFTLAATLDGSLSHTRDLFTNYTAGTVGDFPLGVWIREPISGTYNTMEYDIVRSHRYSSTQENGNIPAPDPPCPGNWNAPNHNTRPCPAAIANPLVIGNRKRAVGTGDMVSAVNGTADSLGYAFWSFANFANKPNLKYLTVDGVDPIQSTYAGGALPQCSLPRAGFCTGILNGAFANIVSGNYPIFSILQMVTLPAQNAAPLAQPLLTASQSVVVNKVPDYVPAPQLNIFRAHWTNSYIGTYPRNGHCGIGLGLLTGNQMGGGVYSIQADLDSCNDNGTELVDVRD